MGTIKREGNVVYVQHLDKMRKVGEIDPGDEDTPGVLYVDRDKTNHLMNVWQAYGFSKEVMDHEDWFDVVCLDETTPEGNRTYLIPRKDLILYGKEYQTGEYEKQYFVALEKLQKYLV